jgi:hypothetical protein
MYKSLILALSVLLAVPATGAFSTQKSSPAASARSGLLRYHYGLVATPKGLGVNVRTRASAHAPLIAHDALLPVGTTVKVMSLSGSWLKIQLDDGTHGWVRWRTHDALYVTPFPNGKVAQRPSSGDGSRTLEMGAK